MKGDEETIPSVMNSEAANNLAQIVDLYQNVDDVSVATPTVVVDAGGDDANKHPNAKSVEEMMQNWHSMPIRWPLPTPPPSRTVVSDTPAHSVNAAPPSNAPRRNDAVRPPPHLPLPRSAASKSSLEKLLREEMEKKERMFGKEHLEIGKTFSKYAMEFSRIGEHGES